MHSNASSKSELQAFRGIHPTHFDRLQRVAGEFWHRERGNCRRRECHGRANRIEHLYGRAHW